mgnify:CR=1 FL=1
MFPSNVVENQPILIDDGCAAAVHGTHSLLSSGAEVAFIAVRDITVLSFICWILANAQGVKQLRSSQFLNPGSCGIFHSFVEVVFFGITPLYAQSNQAQE